MAKLLVPGAPAKARERRRGASAVAAEGWLVWVGEELITNLLSLKVWEKLHASGGQGLLIS